MRGDSSSRRALLRISGFGIAGPSGCLFTDSDDDQPEQHSTTRQTATQTKTPAPSSTTATTKRQTTEQPIRESTTQEQTTREKTSDESADAKSGSVVLTFDDGLNSVYEQTFPIMKEYGFSGLSAVVCDRIEAGGSHPGELTTGELTELQDAGWEISGHSYSKHPALADLSPSDLRWQPKRQIEWLNKHELLADILSLVYPYNNVNESVTDITEEFFDIGFDNLTRPKDGIDDALSVGRVKGHEPGTAKEAIAAAKNQYPTVLMYHDVTQSVQEGNDIFIKEFRETLSYIDSYGSALEIITPSELYQLIR